MSSSLIHEIPESLQLARESALAGNYETSLIYYDGVIAQVVQYDHDFVQESRRNLNFS